MEADEGGGREAPRPCEPKGGSRDHVATRRSPARGRVIVTPSAPTRSGRCGEGQEPPHHLAWLACLSWSPTGNEAALRGPPRKRSRPCFTAATPYPSMSAQ